MPRSFTSTVAVGAALVAALSLAACGSDAGGGGSADAVAVPLPTIGLGSDTGAGRDVADGADAVTRVVMIGDSITVGALPLLIEGFESAGLPAEIGAQGGKRIDVSSDGNPSGTLIAEQFADGAGAGDDVAWIVALGTNDIAQYSEQTEVEEQLRALLAEVPAEVPLVWVNTWFRDRPEATVMVNAAIEQVVAERGNATVADWTALATARGVLRDDGVHPGDEGAQVFADLVVGATRDFLRR